MTPKIQNWNEAFVCLNSLCTSLHSDHFWPNCEPCMIQIVVQLLVLTEITFVTLGFSEREDVSVILGVLHPYSMYIYIYCFRSEAHIDADVLLVHIANLRHVLSVLSWSLQGKGVQTFCGAYSKHCQQYLPCLIILLCVFSLRFFYKEYEQNESK